MGAVSFSLDMRLVECLKEVLPLSILVETGTFKGDTVADGLQYFDRLITIEFSEKLWREAVTRFARTRKIEAHLGDSPKVLAKIRPTLGDAATMYWLDAHWCISENTVGDRSQCPLLSEIRAISQLSELSIVLIDDARLFLAPPPFPHEVAHWPSFQDVLVSLRCLSDKHEVMVVNDVIAFYPRNIKQAMVTYARMHGVDWLAVSPYLNPNSSVLKDLADKEQLILSQQDQLTRLISELVEIRETSTLFFHFESLLRPLMKMILPFYRAVKPRLGDLNQYPPQSVQLPEYHSNGTPASAAAALKISIVTPSFNQKDFIERTINSVLDQSYPWLEYYVQDGASSDGTVEVLQRYTDRLSGWKSSPDNGQSQAINRGFSKTSGEIMAWLNSDDILLPNTLQYVADYFSSHPQVDVVYGHRILIDENDQQVGRWMMPGHDDKVLSWADFIPQETMFWRRRIWEKAGRQVDESFQFAMDWDLLIRFREAGARFARLPRFLGGFRVHPSQKTSAEISGVGINEMNRIRQRTLGRIPLRSEIRLAVRPYLLRHIATDLVWRIHNSISQK